MSGFVYGIKAPIQNDDGLKVDTNGYVYIQGVKVCQLVKVNGAAHLRFLDRCKGRAGRRGEKFVDVPVRRVAELDKDG